MIVEQRAIFGPHFNYVIASAKTEFNVAEIFAVGVNLEEIITSGQLNCKAVHTAAHGQLVGEFCTSDGVGVGSDTIQQDGSQGSVIRLSVRLKA